MTKRRRLKHGWLSPTFATLGVLFGVVSLATARAADPLTGLLSDMAVIASGFFALLGVATIWAVPAEHRRKRAIFAASAAVITAVLMILARI